MNSSHHCVQIITTNNHKHSVTRAGRILDISSKSGTIWWQIGVHCVCCLPTDSQQNVQISSSHLKWFDLLFDTVRVQYSWAHCWCSVICGVGGGCYEIVKICVRISVNSKSINNWNRFGSDMCASETFKRAEQSLCGGKANTSRKPGVWLIQLICRRVFITHR